MRFAWMLFACSVVLAAACDLTQKTGCTSTDDCVSGNTCMAGECVACSTETLGCPCGDVGGYCGDALICNSRGVCEDACGDGIVDAMLDGCDGSDPANATCTEACSFVCDEGFADCNGDAADGCECQVGTVTSLEIAMVNPSGDAPNACTAGVLVDESLAQFACTFDGAQVEIEETVIDVVPEDGPHTWVVDADTMGELDASSAVVLPGRDITTWAIASSDLGILGRPLWVGGAFHEIGAAPGTLTARGSFGTDGFVAGYFGAEAEALALTEIFGVSSQDDATLALATHDPTNSVLLGGVTCLEASFGCAPVAFGNPPVETLGAFGGSDGVVRIVGGVNWAHLIGGTGNDRVVSIGLSPLDESVVAAGDFEGTAFIDESETLVTSEPNAFVVGFSLIGGFRWKLAPEVSDGGFVRAIDLVTTENGLAYVLLRYRGSLTVDDIALPTQPDGYVESIALLALETREVDPGASRVSGAGVLAHGTFYGGADGLAVGSLAYDASNGRVYIALNLVADTELQLAHGTGPSQMPQTSPFEVTEVEGVDIVFGRLGVRPNGFGFASVSRTSGPGNATAYVTLSPNDLTHPLGESLLLAGGVRVGQETFGGPDGTSVVPAGGMFVVRIDSSLAD